MTTNVGTNVGTNTDHGYGITNRDPPPAAHGRHPRPLPTASILTAHATPHYALQEGAITTILDECLLNDAELATFEASSGIYTKHGEGVFHDPLSLRLEPWREHQLLNEAVQSRYTKVAIALAFFTISYNLCEGVVAIVRGEEEESVSLMGFGADSLIEVASAGLVLWHIWGVAAAEAKAAEGAEGAEKETAGAGRNVKKAEGVNYHHGHGHGHDHGHGPGPGPGHGNDLEFGTTTSPTAPFRRFGSTDPYRRERITTMGIGVLLCTLALVGIATASFMLSTEEGPEVGQTFRRSKRSSLPPSLPPISRLHSPP